MRIIERVLFGMMMLIVLSAFTIGDKISSPATSAILCTSMIAVLINRFIINIRDEN